MSQIRKCIKHRVSDANREIPIVGSTDNAGKSVNLVSGIIGLPLGWDFSACIGDAASALEMIDSIYLFILHE